MLNLSRPQNAEELFNLRHASARNVIERIFGVLKWRFRILVYPPQFDMEIQARLPPALAREQHGYGFNRGFWAKGHTVTGTVSNFDTDRETVPLSAVSWYYSILTPLCILLLLSFTFLQ